MVTARRDGERGAAMFLVLMVILILTGIGTFALSNARSEVQSSAFMRQRGVALEIASFAGQAAMQEFSAAPQAYVTRMRSSATTLARCRSNAGLTYIMPPPPCALIYLLDIETRTNMLTDRLVRPADLGAGTPGSLGLSKVTAGFWVEMTDPLDVTRPVPGSPIDGSAGTPRFLDVTMSATGVVFHDDNGDQKINWDTGEGQGAVFTSARGHVLVGPVYGL